MSIKAVPGLETIYTTSTPTAHLEFTTKEELTSAVEKLEPLIKKGILIPMGYSRPKEAGKNPVFGFAAECLVVTSELQKEVIKTIPQLLTVLGESLVGHKELAKTVNVVECTSKDFYLFL